MPPPGDLPIACGGNGLRSRLVRGIGICYTSIVLVWAGNRLRTDRGSQHSPALF